MSNTGIRISEIAKLRHKDINLIEDDGDFYTVIMIDETVSKVRKGRMAISADGFKTWQRYLIYRQEIEYKIQSQD